MTVSWCSGYKRRCYRAFFMHGLTTFMSCCCKKSTKQSHKWLPAYLNSTDKSQTLAGADWSCCWDVIIVHCSTVFGAWLLHHRSRLDWTELNHWCYTESQNGHLLDQKFCLFSLQKSDFANVSDWSSTLSLIWLSSAVVIQAAQKKYGLGQTVLSL